GGRARDPPHGRRADSDAQGVGPRRDDRRRRLRARRRVPHPARPRAPDLLDHLGTGRRVPHLLDSQRLGDDASLWVVSASPRWRRFLRWPGASPSPRYLSRLAAAPPWKRWSANRQCSTLCSRPTRARATWTTSSTRG